MTDYLELRELYHHGIKGQKWGYRRYQNEDGTFTEEGKKRYGKLNEKGNLDARGKRRFKLDQRAIKGQRMYENGTSGMDIVKSRDTVNKILGTIGSGASLALAVRMHNQGNGLISRGRANVNKSLAAIGALSLAGIIANTAVRNKQMKNMRAFYTNGPKQYQEIKSKKEK